MDDLQVRAAATDIFSYLVEFSPSMVREFVMQEPQQTDDVRISTDTKINHVTSSIFRAGVWFLLKCLLPKVKPLLHFCVLFILCCMNLAHNFCVVNPLIFSRSLIRYLLLCLFTGCVADKCCDQADDL